MGQDLSVQRLIDFKASDDGQSVQIRVEDSLGESTLLSFSIECITSLLMTLPGMAAAAIQRRQNNPKARITYPLAHFEVELTSDPGTRILTLRTPDGFMVSFSLGVDQWCRIGALSNQVTDASGRPPRLN